MILTCNTIDMKPSSTEVKAGSESGRGSPAAFLLAQVGAHAASKFAERLAKLELAPHHAGILRILGSTPAMTQQALATMLGMVPSRLVALLDELQERRLIERRENPGDRRSYALHLTEKGRTTLGLIGQISREHQKAILSALSDAERVELAGFLQRIADEQGLTRKVHPGYSKLGGSGDRGTAERR
jgi:DNA-binding MarR family transcriptional regulator